MNKDKTITERLNNTNPTTATLPKPNRPITTTIANHNLDNLHNLDHDQLLEIATTALTTIANTHQEPCIINYENIHIWNDPHDWTTISYEDGRLYYRGEHYTPEQARELIRILTTATERAEHVQGYND